MFGLDKTPYNSHIPATQPWKGFVTGGLGLAGVAGIVAAFGIPHS